MARRTKRCIHYAGDTMTACRQIVSGSMRVKRDARAWANTLPDWRCPACVRALTAAEAIRRAGTIGDLERLAGVTDRAQFWLPFASIRGAGASLDAGCDVLKRKIMANAMEVEG